MADASRFDRDPEALAWARAAVQQLVDRYRKFESQARTEGKLERASQWRKCANLLDMELIGGKTCVITPFDERRPEMLALLERSAPDAS